jgi:hypothetical protein
MRRVATLALLTGLLLAAPVMLSPVLAEGDGPEEAPERENVLRDVIRQSFKGLADVTGEVEFKAEDVEQVLRRHRDLEALMGQDDDFLEAMDDSLKAAYKHLVGSPAYIGWADAHQLEAERYARVTFRVRTTLMKQYFGEYLDGIVERQRKVLAESRDSIDKEQLAELTAELDELAAEYAEVKEELKKAPGPTESEAKLLTKHRVELSRLFGIPYTPAKPSEGAEDEEGDKEAAPEAPSESEERSR